MGLVKTRRLAAMHKQERAKFGKKMVKRYCGKKARAELEVDGQPVPFPVRNDIFRLWDVSL